MTRAVFKKVNRAAVWGKGWGRMAGLGGRRGGGGTKTSMTSRLHWKGLGVPLPMPYFPPHPQHSFRRCLGCGIMTSAYLTSVYVLLLGEARGFF